MPTWPHLAPPPPKKRGQVGSKIDPSWGVDFRAVFVVIFAQILCIFITNDIAEVANSLRKTIGLLTFLNFWLMCCWGDLLIGF